MDKITKARIVINTCFCIFLFLLLVTMAWLIQSISIPLFNKKEDTVLIYKDCCKELKVLPNCGYFNFDYKLILKEKYFNLNNNILKENFNFKSVDGFNISFDCIITYDINLQKACSQFTNLNDINSGFHTPGFFNNKELTSILLSNEVFVSVENYSVVSIKEKILSVLSNNIFDEDDFIENVNIRIENLIIKKTDI